MDRIPIGNIAVDPIGGLQFLMALVALTALDSGVAGAALVINEILVDPEGSDSGREFVELLNTGPDSIDLADIVFQFANGAEGAVWKTRWSGEAGLHLGPGEFYLIVDRNWMGPAQSQAEVYLGLQNGPDAVRLSRAGTTLDMVGYGPLTDPEMMEGSPASVKTGQSLSRRPDGGDTDDNGLDLVSAAATPGVRNFEPWSLALVHRILEPPSLEQPGQDLQLEISLENNGTNAIPVVDLELWIGSERRPARLAEIRPEDSRTIVWNLAPRQWGTLSLTVYVLPPAMPDTLFLDLGKVQVGPGKLLLNEIMAAPSQGQQEWIEFQAGPGEINLGGYSLRDEDGSYRRLPELTLDPGALVVLAQDSSALAGWLAQNRAHGGNGDCGSGPTPIRVLELGSGWPSLNNSTATGRDYADRLYLADSTGTVLDHLTWGGNYPGAVPVPGGGRSLERIAPKPTRPVMANWTGSTAPAGSTPGCPNSVFLAGTDVKSLLIDPRVLDPDRGANALHIRYQVPVIAAGGDVRIFDLWGGLIRDFGSDRLGPGPRDLLWDGRDETGRQVSAGAYVVLLLMRGVDGSVLDRSRVLIAVRQGAAR